MRNRIVKSISTVTILLFLISLVPFTMLQSEKEQGLREVISQIQKLQQSPEKSSSDFEIVFTNTITTLKSAAGLSQVFAEKRDSSEAEKPTRIISVRLHYLIPPESSLSIEEVTKQLPAEMWEFIYQSHIPLPETPPPMRCFC